MARKALTKKMRFEVLKRDSFTCQYCGAKAPDALMRIDHIHPVAKGGTNDILNLITSCFECNAGKSDRLLSDDAVIDKQRAQLEELQARREQLDLMFQWQQDLADMSKSAASRVCDVWNERVKPFAVTEHGRKSFVRLIKQFSVSEVLAAIHVSADQYLESDDGKNPTADSVNMAFKKIGGICRLARLDKEDPDLRRMYYIRGIVRNRFNYCDAVIALRLLKQAIDLNASLDSLDDLARSAKSWSAWRSSMQCYIDENSQDDSGEDVE